MTEVGMEAPTSSSNLGVPALAYRVRFNYSDLKFKTVSLVIRINFH